MTSYVHSCFNTSGKCVVSARIHIPIARACGLQCFYCGHKNDGNLCNSDSRPGSSPFAIDTKEQMVLYLETKFKQYPNCKIIGVSGPGEPFDNKDKMSILLEVMEAHFNNKLLCVCTNGSNYDAFVDICNSGNKYLRYITVTVNTLNPLVATQIYGGLTSICQAEKFINSQLNIIAEAKSRGITVKVNSILLPNINQDSIESMYNTLSTYHIDCFNLMRLHNYTVCDKDYCNQFDILYKKLSDSGHPMLNKCYYCASNSCGVI